MRRIVIVNDWELASALSASLVGPVDMEDFHTLVPTLPELEAVVVVWAPDVSLAWLTSAQYPRVSFVIMVDEAPIPLVRWLGELHEVFTVQRHEVRRAFRTTVTTLRKALRLYPA